MAPRIGIIGVGTFGLTHLRALDQLDRIGRAQLVAACDLNDALLAERAQEFGFTPYADHEAMLESEALDGVTIVTPDHLHRPLALDVLSAGCHALVEKPMDVTVEGCQEIASAADDAGLLAQVDFHKRYDPWHQDLRTRLARGDLGDLLYGYVNMEDRLEVPRDWLPQWAGSSSPVWFLGVHFFDLTRWLIGSEVVRVCATGNRRKLPSLGVDAWDAIQVHAEFANGANVSYQLSWILPEGFESIVRQGMRLVGTEGIAECDSSDRGTRICTAADGMATINAAGFRELTSPDGRVVHAGYVIDSIVHFVDNVRELKAGRPLTEVVASCPSGNDGIEATRIAVAAHQSLESGSAVELVR